ncbi:hypothetical protein FRC10_011305 [Ceratobasidium sp. 414]|nr:hypothetical protein FRC10_011305 [Ceratobasidium sp. 414]
MNRAQDYEFNLWDDDYNGTPPSYPFIYGPDGQGEIHAQSDDQASYPSTAGTSAERPTPSASGPQPSVTDGPQSQSVKPGVVSYAIPTPVTPLSQQAISSSTSDLVSSSASASPSPISSPSILVQASTTPVVTHSPTPAQRPSSLAFTTPLPETSPQSSPSPSPSTPLASPVSATPITSVVFATPTHPPPAPSTPAQAFRHTPGFIVLIILCLLVFLGTLFAALSWFLNRRRRKDDENWIGSLVDDEPSDYGGGATEHKNIGRRDTSELEEGGDGEHPGTGEVGEDSGRAGVGASRWLSDDVPAEPGRTYTTAPQFMNTSMSGYGFSGAPASNVYTPGSVHGFTPNPDYRRPSILQRGPPPVSGYDNSYGLDGGGLTFRRDPAIGGAYLAPVTEYADIITPNPYSRSPTPHPDPHTRAPDPALTATRDSVSHYSYALDGAGPFAVTNLMPGDISSSASLASLGAGGRAGSLGLPTGRLDDLNPWKRYEGVKSRGGAAGEGPGITREARTAGNEAGEGGWVGTIRSGLYMAVGKIVGGSKDPEGVDKAREEKDRFTFIPGPVPRQTRNTSKSTTRSLAASRQTRILQRLGSTGTTDTRSIASSHVTAYSSDEGMLFSTRATSRRDTTSTRVTTRSWSARGGKKEDKDEGGGEGGVSEMKARVMSTASSEWGSGELVRVLGLEGGRSRKERGD